MSTTPEGKVKAAVKLVLKARGIWYFMPQNVGMGTSGVPDFICCAPQLRGKMLAIETKAPGKLGNLSALQARQIEAIQRARGLAIVIDDAKNLEEFLDHVGCTPTQSIGSQGDQAGADSGMCPDSQAI